MQYSCKIWVQALGTICKENLDNIIKIQEMTTVCTGEKNSTPQDIKKHMQV